MWRVRISRRAPTSDPARYESWSTNPGALADQVVHAHAIDASSLLHAALRVNACAISASVDFHLVPASLVAVELGLPASPPTAQTRCLFKNLTREAVDRIGRPVEWLAGDVRSAALAPATYPRIFKPSDESGSFGVRLVRDSQDYEAARDRLRGDLINGLRYPRSGAYLLEEYLEGPEYSAEAAWNHAFGDWEIVAFARKYTTQGADFVELGHVCPAPLLPELYATCANADRKWLRAVGLSLSVSHVEFRIVDGEPALVEINARPAGGYIANSSIMSRVST